MLIKMSKMLPSPPSHFSGLYFFPKLFFDVPISQICLYTQSLLLSMALSFVQKCMTVVFTLRYLRFLRFGGHIGRHLEYIRLLKGDKVALFIYRLETS